MRKHHIKHLLGALEYPGASSFSSNDSKEFRRIVFDLEDKFIRALKKDQRDTLKESSSNWESNFKQYLEDDVNCTFRYLPGSNEEEVLEWLLHLAISYVHDDLKEAGPSGATSKPSTQGQSFTDWDAQETQKLCQSLLDALHIEQRSTLLEGLLLAKEMLADSVLPLARPKQAKPEGRNSKVNQDAVLLLHQASLGFTTNDPGVDRAATLMRMLFINDLRKLQTNIDAAIVDVQEYTQNPKANAKLGLVGR